ncbi:MAG TPA: hypothetical protein VHO72_12495 [Bacteroidales bacterium]|nr:hypothetical protein [Bacteroidales bacterium]
MKLFNKDGRLLIPETPKQSPRPDKKKNEKFIVREAFCPNGCSIIDNEHPIKNNPGLRFRFRRKNVEGEFVISAIEGDFEKIVLSGTLENGVKDELFCPHCNTPFQKLMKCECKADADLVVFGLTPKLDFNNAIAFCNVTGCQNGTTIDSGTVIRRFSLETDLY